MWFCTMANATGRGDCTRAWARARSRSPFVIDHHRKRALPFGIHPHTRW